MVQMLHEERLPIVRPGRHRTHQGTEARDRLMPQRMRVLAPDPWGESAKKSMRELLDALIGKRRGTVGWLIVCSTLSGLVEAAFLAIVVDVGVSVVKKGPKGGGQAAALFHLHTSTHTLVIAAAVLVVLRSLLQVPLAVLPARIASE